MSMKKKFQILMVLNVAIVACLILAVNDKSAGLCLLGMVGFGVASLATQAGIAKEAALSAEANALAMKTLFDAPILVLLLDFVATVTVILGAIGFIQHVNANFAAGLMTVFAAILAVIYC